MVRRRAFAFGFLTAASLAACQLIVGVKDEDGFLRPDAAATADAVDEDAPADDPCKKYGPPPPPEAGTVPADPGGQSSVFAVRKFYIRPRGSTIMGYDLDGRCTGSQGSTTSESPCRPPGKILADGDGGVDNALAALTDKFAIMSDAGDLLGDLANEQVDLGKATNIIGLFDYNGLPNDDDVSAQVAMGLGLSSTGCDDEVLNDDGGLTPRWDGCDVWAHAPGQIIDGPQPVWQTAKGYVADGVLVVRTERMKLGLIYGEITAEDCVLTARIEGTEGAYRLVDGIFAGRVSAANVVEIVRLMDLNGVLVCKDEARFSLLRGMICGVRDLPLHRADDGRGLACEAVSFAFGFEAEKARLGNAGTFPTPDCISQDVTCPN